VFKATSLNAFAALGRSVHREVREYIQTIFAKDTKHPDVLQNNKSLQGEVLIPIKEVNLHLPMEIGDYTDFFAGINHAHTVGSLFRGPTNALQPNYKHLPVGYHGRASSVVVSGTPVRRPWGQVLLDPTADPKIPTFTPCRRLDIELELGMFVCKANALGENIPIDEVDDYIFGYVLMNDWSARDIQTWEYVPLGPFNAKNFATTISGWVVLPDALEPFAVEGIANDTEVQSYLKDSKKKNMYDIQLEVDLISKCALHNPLNHIGTRILTRLTAKDGNSTTITKTSGKNLLWSFRQMLAHHTISGCPMRPGDLLGSGTISGSDDSSCGSLLEQNKAGKQKVKLQNGEERVFLLDGDSITIRGVCGNEEDGLVGFGLCHGQIVEAVKR